MWELLPVEEFQAHHDGSLRLQAKAGGAESNYAEHFNPPKVFGLSCPQCGTVRVKRRDSIALGLHHVICVRCPHAASDVIDRFGCVYSTGPEARQGGG